jgi:hypothetical protein
VPRSWVWHFNTTSPATTVSWTGYTACTDHDKCGFSAGFVSYKSLKTWTGKTVLDVGAWDGFFSFEFERRGAKRVLAVDTWTGPHALDTFLLARERFGSKVEHERVDVHDISPADRSGGR